MEVRILGPVEAVDDGRPVALGGTRQRALLAMLLLHANEVVPSERLLEELWSGRPPETGVKALQVTVSQLRRALEAGGGSNGLVVTRPPGYMLSVGPDQLDLKRFERLVDDGRGALARGDAAAASRLLGEALALWRGPPLADLTYEPFAQAEIRRLDELRLAALEDRIDADLALGRHREVIPELEAAVTRHPLRERLRALLMLALYRAGRQADALAAYRQGRRLLVDELGIEPGSELQRLEAQVLAHDPALDAPSPSRLPALRRHRRLGVLAAAGAALVAAAAGVGLVLARGGSEAAAVTVPPNSVALIDPDENRVVATLPAGVSPGPIATLEGTVWALSRNDATVTKIDAGSRRYQLEGTGNSGLFALVAGEDAFWSTDGFAVDRIDPRRPPPAAVLNVGDLRTFQTGLTVGLGSLWLANGIPTLSRIDLRETPTGFVSDPAVAIADVIPLGRPFPAVRHSADRASTTLVATGEGAVWAVNGRSGRLRLWRVDPGSGSVTTRLSSRGRPTAIVAGGGATWIADDLRDAVLRVDPHRSGATTIAVGKDPAALVLADGDLWVANSGDGTVTRIDTRTGEVVATIRVGQRPQGIAVRRGPDLGDRARALKRVRALRPWDLVH